MATPSVSTPNHFNNILNHIADATYYAVSKTDLLIPSAVLGGIGGRIIGIGSPMGIFQGVSSAGYHTLINRPFSRYIERNTGLKANQITHNTASLFGFINLIMGIMVPILLTKQFGPSITQLAIDHLPKSGIITNILVSPARNSYTLSLGILVNVAPALTQYGISWWRKEAEKANH